MNSPLRKLVASAIVAFNLFVGATNGSCSASLPMDSNKSYIFHADFLGTSPLREVEVVFDLKGFHLFDQSKEIVSKDWTDIERIDERGPLLVTHFKTGPEFAVRKAELKFDIVVEFRILALQQIIAAHRQKK